MRNYTLNTAATAVRRTACDKTTALNFRPLTIESIKEIERLLPLSRSRANDFTIGGLMMWADYFNYEYCIYGNTLFVKGVSELRPDLPAFSLPVGGMPLSCAVDLIMDYCRVNGVPLRFSAVPDDRVDELRSLVPGRIERLNNWSDYIYDARALASLAGKRLGKKRNHVNRFMAENEGYTTERLSGANLYETRRAYTGWLQDNPPAAASAAEESAQTLAVLDNYGAFPFEGLVLRDGNGRIVAFTIGEVIGDTLYTHIEKIDYNVAGAGETINKLFASYITERYPHVDYINREEDAGDEGLRQAKLSYHPCIILGKYDIVV